MATGQENGKAPWTPRHEPEVVESLVRQVAKICRDHWFSGQIDGEQGPIEEFLDGARAIVSLVLSEAPLNKLRMDREGRRLIKALEQAETRANVETKTA